MSGWLLTSLLEGLRRAMLDLAEKAPDLTFGLARFAPSRRSVTDISLGDLAVAAASAEQQRKGRSPDAAEPRRQ